MTMPSQLQVAAATSAKQMMDFATSNGSSTGSANLRLGNGGAEKADSGNSGYSADGSAAVMPPDYIDFLEANNSTHCDERQSSGSKSSNRAERRKAVELSFTASKTKEDLEKGGMTVPVIRTDTKRYLAGCEVDMSKVKLKMAKTVKASPFLFTRKIPVEFPEDQSIYDSLFRATYQSYEKNDGLHWDSSTSSVTSSESDGSTMPPPALVIPPLLEDAISTKEELKIKDEQGKTKCAGSKRKRAVIDSNTPKLMHTTMNDALEASSDARVVTLSFAPFIVVHVNTSYIRLTGYSSAKVLGRPLHECVGGKCKEWLDSSHKSPHPVATLHERFSAISSKENSRLTCHLKVSLVGPQLEGKKDVDTNTVTHYSICFVTRQGAPTENAKKMAPTTPAVGHQLVMG